MGYEQLFVLIFNTFVVFWMGYEQLFVLIFNTFQISWDVFDIQEDGLDALFCFCLCFDCSVTFDGTFSFRRKCLETYYAVISWDRTVRRLVELQEMSSCAVARINTGRRFVQF